MMPNVTIAQTAVLSAIDFPKGRDTIVMTELDFPSVRYAYEEMARRLGARVVVVKSDDGMTIALEKLLAAIDERTRLVAVSHVLFRSAFLMDADAICERAHRSRRAGVARLLSRGGHRSRRRETKQGRISSPEAF